MDPRISYSTLVDEFEGDDDLVTFLEAAKTQLHTYYKTHYLNAGNSAPKALLSNQSRQVPSTIDGSPQKSFTARFRKPRAPIDELVEFWKLPQEDFETCNPIQWWSGRRSSFPNLYRLACDVLAIPGEFSITYFVLRVSPSLPASAVAVERVFSGGRDTISLRRASLKAETIKTPMFVKKRLHLERERIKRALQA